MFPQVLIDGARDWARACREAGAINEADLLDLLAGVVERATAKEQPDMSATVTNRRTMVSGPIERGRASMREPEPTLNRPVAPIADREPDGEVRAGLFLLNSNLASIEKEIFQLEEVISLVIVPEEPATARGDAPSPPPPSTAIGADLRQLNETASRLFDRLRSLRYRVSI